MADQHPLREARRPDFELGDDPVRVVDLFAGCGGLTLGLAQAAQTLGRPIDIRLAVDLEPDAIAVYAANFPKAAAEVGTVETYFDGALGAKLTKVEERTKGRVGEVDVLVGGPPCQGHSDLNNHTRRADPKNALYGRMARAAEVLMPAVVIIENVPAVRHDKAKVVDTSLDHLRGLGYHVADEVVELRKLGVPQTRRRHILLAVASSISLAPVDLLADAQAGAEQRNLRWAIGDLVKRSGVSSYDTASRPNAVNDARMRWLLQNDQYDLPNALRPVCHQNEHSYKSMYGRLSWDHPAQTITSGFGSMGQGRYMHPEAARCLTPHEAARIQGLPDYFHFEPVTRRGVLATMIGNAVPPQLSYELGRRALASSRASTDGDRALVPVSGVT